MEKIEMGEIVSKKNLALLLATSLTVTLLPCGGMTAQAATEVTTEEYEELVSTYSIREDIPNYQEYVVQFSAEYPDKEYRVAAADYVRYEEDGVIAQPQLYENYEGASTTALLATETALVEYEVEIAESGFYDMSLLYYPIEGKNSEIQRAIFVDGALPYSELATVEFNRIWVNNVVESNIDENGILMKNWEKDNQGNDVKPKTIEQPEWVESYLYDSKGYITTPLSIYLESGTHTVTLVSQKEPMLLQEIIFSNSQEIKSYETVKAAWDAQDRKSVV